MKAAKVRFLEKGETPVVPKGMKILPKGVQKKYIEKRKPYRVDPGEILIAILQTTAEEGMSSVWRKNARTMLERLKKDGIAIIIPPTTGELPWDILPMAKGKKLMQFFAFAGAKEALRRMGKQSEESRFLLAGGDAEVWRSILLSMGTDVNHLSILTDAKKEAEVLGQELFEEYGLLTEVFASPKNPLFAQADVVFGCGLEQRNYSHILKEGAIFIDLAENRPVLRKLQESRLDVTVIDGFFFRRGEKQMDGSTAEAEAFLSCPIFRENWSFSPEYSVGKEILCELEEKGYAVSGFSIGEKRVKIRKNP